MARRCGSPTAASQICSLFSPRRKGRNSRPFWWSAIRRASRSVAEEHKLGIRGSSTCPLILTDCRVPAENLLGEAGKGHHIAFNALNMGRFKLGAACTGGARQVLQDAIQYAKERKAFGKSIAEFGLIQEKLAECAAGVYAGESLVYRTIGMIDAALADLDPCAQGASREIEKRIEEYAVECSIVKVWVSEMLQRVANHSVQIHGGYGYVEEYPAERAYRDARINPIFEGTNEINRLIITGWLMKRAMKGELPLLAAIKQLMDEVISPSRHRRGARGAAGRRAKDAGASQEAGSVCGRRGLAEIHAEPRRPAGGNGRDCRLRHRGLCDGVVHSAGRKAHCRQGRELRRAPPLPWRSSTQPKPCRRSKRRHGRWWPRWLKETC